MEDLELEEFFEDFPEDLEELEEVDKKDDSLPSLEDSSGEVISEEPKDVVEEVKEEPKTVDKGVERYSSTTVSYPCFILDSKTEFPKHVISALSRMIESSLSLDNLIKVYIDNEGELLSLGGISSVQVKATIDLLGRDAITAYFEEGYLLKGDLIYTLSS